MTIRAILLVEVTRVEMIVIQIQTNLSQARADKSMSSQFWCRAIMKNHVQIGVPDVENILQSLYPEPVMPTLYEEEVGRSD